jgi:uncharacterized membrane protein (DUF2068 family)
VRIVVAALFLDGGVTLVEGWALHRRFHWSGWLVLSATSMFLPFEFFMLIRHPSAGRAMLLLTNVLIAAYFLRHRVPPTGDSKSSPAPD